MKHFILTMLLCLLTVPAFAAPVKVDVSGMVCDFCAQALNKVFAKEESVESLDIDLNNQAVTIHVKDGQTISDETINKLIYYAGYDVRAIHRE